MDLTTKVLRANTKMLLLTFDRVTSSRFDLYHVKKWNVLYIHTIKDHNRANDDNIFDIFGILQFVIIYDTGLSTYEWVDVCS